MALTLKYVGARPYCEITLPSGSRMGFARGMERDDIPDDWIRVQILPAIENGGTMWEVIDTTGKDQAKEMAKVIEEVAAPVVETPVAPEPVVETPVVETPVPVTISDEELMSNGFSQGLTRSQMMTWCTERGVTTINTDTKSKLTDKARQYLAGASE